MVWSFAVRFTNLISILCSRMREIYQWKVPIMTSITAVFPVLKIELGPPPADFGSLWSPHKVHHNEQTMYCGVFYPEMIYSFAVRSTNLISILCSRMSEIFQSNVPIHNACHYCCIASFFDKTACWRFEQGSILAFNVSVSVLSRHHRCSKSLSWHVSTS